MLYAMTVPAFRNGLTALSAQLEKARQWAAENSTDETALLSASLAPDMFPLRAQIYIICGQALQSTTRLGAAGAPEIADDVSDLTGLQAQITTTQDWLSTLQPGAFGMDDARPVSFDLPNGMIFDLSAADYVRDWALPQYYFHLVAAYAILRHLGVPLGKADFAAYMLHHLRPGTMPAAG